MAAVEFPIISASSIFALLLSAIPFRTAAQSLVLDDDTGSPTFTDSGDWAVSAQTGYNNGTYKTHAVGSGTAWAAWTGTIATPGSYRISTHFRAGSNRATDVPFTITNNSVVESGQLDQSGSAAIVTRTLGIYSLAAGSIEIRLTDAGSSGFVIADAFGIAPWIPTNPAVQPPMSEGPRPFAGVPIAVSVQIEAGDHPDDAIQTAVIEYRLNGSVTAQTAPLDEPSIGNIWTGELPAQAPGTTIAAIARATNSGGLEGVSGETIWSTGPDRTAALASPAYSVLIAGQSNASGRGTLGIDDEAPDNNVLLFGNDYEWKVAFEPIDEARNQVDSVSSDAVTSQCPLGHSFALAAAKDILPQVPGFVRLIPAPHGGTSITDWMPASDAHDRGTLFGSANVRVETAATGGTIDALWWWQGERESSGASNQGQFVARHTNLISTFRSHWGSSLPVVYVQLARTVGNNEGHQVISEYQRQLETGSGSANAIANHFMVVAFDGGMCDTVHVDLEGQKEIGRRIGLAMREHVFGENVDGTGPRLLHGTPVVFADAPRTRIRVAFDRPIQAGASNFDNLFRVFNGAVEVSSISAARDPENNSAVLLILPAAISSSATVSYGDRGPTQPVARLTDVVRGATNLPAPRFGPLAVSAFSDVENWRSY